MYSLDMAIKKTCESLTKEELIDLVCLLIDENLHTAGRKRKDAKGA